MGVFQFLPKHTFFVASVYVHTLDAIEDLYVVDLSLIQVVVCAPRQYEFCIS